MWCVNFSTTSLLLSQFLLCLHFCTVMVRVAHRAEFPHITSLDFVTETSKWIKCFIKSSFALLFLTKVINESTTAVNVVSDSHISFYCAVGRKQRQRTKGPKMQTGFERHDVALTFLCEHPATKFEHQRNRGGRGSCRVLCELVPAFKPCWALLQVHASAVVIHCCHSERQLREPHCEMLKIYI